MANIYCITKFTILIHNKFSRFLLLLLLLLLIFFFYVLEFDHSFNYEIDFAWNGRRLWRNKILTKEDKNWKELKFFSPSQLFFFF